jgi:hypothetical protein
LGAKAEEIDSLATYYEVTKKEVVESWATRGVFQVVGNGEVTDSNPNSPKQCGKMYGFVGCVNTHLHDKTSLDGVNHRGNAYVKKRIRRCFNPRCPRCFKTWAIREAKLAAWRTEKASKKYGKAEHIIASVPKSEYGMFDEGYKVYLQGRARVQKILSSRGVIGGGLIFHGFGFANTRESRIKGVPFGWYWSVHWHVVGFLADRYSMCRDCVHNCDSDRAYCQDCRRGFEGRTRRAYESDGWIVKVAEKRKTILGTFYYQLNHSTIVPSKERFHSLTWFGVCGIRALKLDRSEFKENPELCPICGSECVPLRYVGSDMTRIAKEFWVKEFEEPALDKNGFPIWAEKDECVSGSSARHHRGDWD